MAIQFKSYQQIVGDMLRKITSITGINDFHKGSVILTIIEAMAQEIFTEYGALINILDNFSLDNVSGIDLDNKAKEFGLERLEATFSSGFTKIIDNTITKKFTTVYAGSTPPIAGDTNIKVADASEFPAGSYIYIGRTTANVEGPIQIGTPVNNTSYWDVPLITPLAKNHNLNETVILAQGGNRTVASNIIVNIPASNISPAVSFKILTGAILADGEDTLNNILVSCVTAGSIGNAPLGAITQFGTTPFNGAQVTNTIAFSNGRDLETDQELRERIKNHIQSLSKGTLIAILNGIVG
jgi:uncharacterized phage protein gp47/JayE